MKKIVSILLAVAMILAMNITAFAAEEPNTSDLTTIIIEGDNRTYDAFRLLDLKVSHKEEGHDYTCPAENGGEHVADCYNYNYTIPENSPFLPILQEEVYNHTDNSFWTAQGIIKPAQASITADHILKYLSGLIGDNGSNYSTLRKTADRIYRDIQEGNPADYAAYKITLASGENEDIQKGYWMIVETTSGLTDFAAKSVVMLSTNAMDEITVTPKTDLPVVEKKVKDTDDSDNAEMTDHQWQDAADHDIGDKIPFKLTATLPTNMDSFEEYKLVFHDTMAAGLELVPNSIKVYLYANKVVADADSNMDNSVNNNVPVYNIANGDNANYILKTESFAAGDNCSFEFTVVDAKDITGAVGGNAIVITYEAQLTEAAVLGKAGNANSVYLEFSNDPYSQATGKTAVDTVKVFTYGLTINKKDAHGHNLEGAGFTLYKYSAANSRYEVVGAEKTGGTSFVWKGLDDGDYMLRESKIPEGYNEMEDITFTIQATHDVDSTDPQLTAINSVVLNNGDPNTGMFTKEVINHTGTVLPETGAEGTFFLITGGSLLVILAAVFMITRKKMSIYED